MIERSWMRLLDFLSDNLKSKIKNPKWVGIFAVVLTLLFGGVKARAQQPKKVPRIGYLTAASLSSNQARIEAFRQGLSELGYVEGKNIVIEYRFAEGKLDHLPALAAELVRLKVEIIVTTGPASTRPAKEATTTIPIVMASDSDPVGMGFVSSLAGPIGNITGLSTLAPEISGKQLELLKEIVPKLSRVAILRTWIVPGSSALSLKVIEPAAAAFGVRLQYINVRAAKDIEAAFRAAGKERAGAVLVLSSLVLNSHRKQVVDSALKSRLPAVYPLREYAEDGGLMYYGANTLDLFRRAAVYVDKILKGAKPADLPVQQATKFEFIINLKAAKQISLTIPVRVLERANQVIR